MRIHIRPAYVLWYLSDKDKATATKDEMPLSCVAAMIYGLVGITFYLMTSFGRLERSTSRNRNNVQDRKDVQTY